MNDVGLVVGLDHYEPLRVRTIPESRRRRCQPSRLPGTHDPGSRRPRESRLTNGCAGQVLGLRGPGGRGGRRGGPARAPAAAPQPRAPRTTSAVGAEQARAAATSVYAVDLRAAWSARPVARCRRAGAKRRSLSEDVVVAMHSASIVPSRSACLQP
jgi:hypothetical protein